MDKIDHLRSEIAKREAELTDLKAKLAFAESEQKVTNDTDAQSWTWPLEKHGYERYSRQMIVPKFGLQG